MRRRANDLALIWARFHRKKRGVSWSSMLGMEVVIEGVENEAQMDVLRVIGCTLFQGYHLARPMDEQSYLTRFAVPLIVQERHIG